MSRLQAICRIPRLLVYLGNNLGIITLVGLQIPSLCIFNCKKALQVCFIVLNFKNCLKLIFKILTKNYKCIFAIFNITDSNRGTVFIYSSWSDGRTAIMCDESLCGEYKSVCMRFCWSINDEERSESMIEQRLYGIELQVTYNKCSYNTQIYSNHLKPVLLLLLVTCLKYYLKITIFQLINPQISGLRSR